MLTIQHKMYGEGKVINKEMKENDIILTAQFGDGSERRFAAESFRLGFVSADGELKNEIDGVIAAQQAAVTAWRNSVSAAAPAPVVTAPVTSARHGRTPKRKVTAKGPIQEQYEMYLEAADYSVIGISGNDSTVPQYSRAVEKVVEREGLSWSQLSNDIANIVQKYDKDGAEEDFGNRGNKTVINALKRFQEFVSD
jgi:hypothetical protein